MARSGVPLATVKYYLREGLLMPGASIGATQADYGTVAPASGTQPAGPLGVLALLGGLSVVGAAAVSRITQPDAAAQFRQDLKQALRSRRPAP